MSQAAVDTGLGRPRGYVAQLETGRVRPPERAVCLELGRVLGVSGKTVWDAARPERLEGLDPDLFEHYEGSPSEPTELTDAERDLVHTLRMLDDAVAAPEGTSLAEHLDDLALATLVDVKAGGDTISALGIDAVHAMRSLQNLSDLKRREVVKVLVAACTLATR